MARIDFFYMTVDISKLPLLFTEKLLGLAHNEYHQDKAYYTGTDCSKGHYPIVVEHHNKGTYEHCDGSNQGTDTLIQGLAYGVDIVSHPA